VIRERTLRVSPRLVEAIRGDAEKRGKSIAWCVERAWTIAWPRLAQICGPTPFEQDCDFEVVIPNFEYEHARAEAIYAERFASEAVESLTLGLATAVVEDMTDESYRLARSLGWLVERAWCIALDAEATSTWFVASDFAGDTLPMPRAE